VFPFPIDVMRQMLGADDWRRPPDDK